MLDPTPDRRRIPDREAPLSGGPFDGETHRFDPENWEPDEAQYRQFFKEGIIPDITLLSRRFPEGAVYRWDAGKRVWSYIGKPDRESEENFRNLLGHFGVEPEEPL
jgi:hypothetical protein